VFGNHPTARAKYGGRVYLTIDLSLVRFSAR